jgi:ABC-2 type transport system ATP-binding protein
MGEVLHVSGRDPELLRQSLAPFMAGDLKWQQVETTLEEVFISLMNRSERN